MDLKQLRFFVAVAEEGSFTAASLRCHIAQPSLSQQILNLESELGEPLFHRRPRGVELTGAGKLIYERAKTVLAESDEIVALFHDREELHSGRLTLGIIPTIAPYLLPKLLEDFRSDYPRVGVRIKEGQTRDLIQSVVTEEVDFAVVSDLDDGTLTRWSLHKELMGQEALLLAVGSAHPLAHRERVSIEDLPSEDGIILLSEGHCLRDQSLRLCHPEAKGAQLECEQLPTMLALVSAGLGMGIVPETSALPAKVAGVKYLRFYHPEPRREINLMKRRGRAMNRAATVFVDYLRRFQWPAV